MTRHESWLVTRSPALPLVGILVVSGLVLLLIRRGTDASPEPISPSAERTHRLAALPPVILWAWERPEDLRFLPANRVGVSFLAESLTLSADEVKLRPRLDTLQVTPGTALVACARIEVDSRRPPALSPAQAATASAAIAGLAPFGGISAVQVDFDATVSQRPFYATLLGDLRAQLPPQMPLSITALASWCMDDPWIAGLPVDEAVPMLFRMGPDSEDVRLLLAQGRDFSVSVCRGSVGISTDEPIRDLPPGRRRYVFRPEGWSQSAVRAVVAKENQR